jgi:hypothetical protein
MTKKILEEKFLKTNLKLNRTANSVAPFSFLYMNRANPYFLFFPFSPRANFSGDYSPKKVNNAFQ